MNLVLVGDVGETERYAGIAREIARACDYTTGRVLAMEVDGDLAALKEDHHAALHAYTQAFEMADASDQSVRAVGTRCQLLRRIAEAHLNLGQPGPAEAHVGEALKLAEKTCYDYEHAICARILAAAEVGGNNGAGAIRRLRDAIKDLSRLSPWCLELAKCEILLADALIGSPGKCDGTEAFEHLLAARRIYSNLGVGSDVMEIDRRMSSDFLKELFTPTMSTHSSMGCPGSTGTVDLKQYGIVTCDPDIIANLERWGPTDVRILIMGETGVGKELVAKAIHTMSRRQEGPFIAVDCGALVENLAASELFGHVRGSFTGAVKDRVGLVEDADGGTLFLDEVGELGPELQIKFLRVLEEGVVRQVGGNEGRRIRVRILSATTKDLWKDVETGRFRSELYYRLKGVVLRISPLRERPDDIQILIKHFLDYYCRQNKRTISISERARLLLIRYTWPGNVRELRHVVEALVVSHPDGTVIEAQCVEMLLERPQPDWGLKSAIKAIEHRGIEKALEASRGNKTEAARMLGISRKTLVRRLKKWGERR